MTSFPRSPRLLKGALVAYDLPDTTPKVIVFQYNPETLSRSLQAQTSGGEQGRAGPVRFKGAPVETISLEIAIDAADDLEIAQAEAIESGIHSRLAALETLLYPPSSAVLANLESMSLGVLEVIPPMAPFVLFVYGRKRILPVQITSFQITEEAHDVNLNPIRARVSLGLRVLSYSDLLPDHPGHAVFLAHQIAKEALAAKGIVGSLDAVTGNATSLL
ncbi:MAG: hypothetical protein JXB35_15605 [Anaerolineae bacterium]|nr:hypothetical protein [Anaerolineae bacterium]